MKILWDSIKWLIPTVQVPTWTDGLAALLIVIVGLLLIQFVIRPIVFKFARMLEKRGHPVMSDITKSIFPSMRNAFIFIVLLVACSSLVEVDLFAYPKLRNLIDSVYVYFGYKALYDVLSFYLKNPERFETGKDQDLLTPFFLRMSKVVVMVIAMFTIASLWNFNLNGFLTAIGLTGVALAFGIRDTLAHIFGGMSVVLDKPFQIGDWVMTGDEKIDGTIEDINLRSTLIQTSDKGLVYVPNSYLVNRPIYNLSKRTQRKVEHYLFLSTENSEEKLVQLVETLREQIALHPKTLKTVIHVAVDEIRPNACRLLIRYFVNTNDTEVMLQVRQDILFVAKHYCEEYEVIQVDPAQAQFDWHD
ncbi:mechanosensitive ion channel family protein [Solibacillus sp. FSL R7-0668]|uniref:mechanosensitive ion channel family protein n=1 Tax=Solibacillus sp. FSL R7-0668 TaxID=2921688 RepID=UPI0030F986A8